MYFFDKLEYLRGRGVSGFSPAEVRLRRITQPNTNEA